MYAENIDYVIIRQSTLRRFGLWEEVKTKLLLDDRVKVVRLIEGSAFLKNLREKINALSPSAVSGSS